jgi:glycosyltransferase involved in cell wall biosynthesis
MRILYVCADPDISPFGGNGPAAHVRAITGALAARGHAVTVACLRTDGGNALPLGLAVAVMPEGEHQQAVWLGGQMRRLGIDVIIERGSPRSGAAVEAVGQWPIPLLLEVDAPLVDDTRRRWESRLLTAADHVIAISEVVAWHALACGVPRERLSVVANGVDPMRFAGVQGHSVRLEYDLRRRFVVGYCGSLQPWHGVTDAVAALAMLPPSVMLLVVGDGPERQAIHDCAFDLDVADRVVMTGAVPETEVPAYLAAVDLGVAPYTAVERFYLSPLKVLEYCAAGLPVVATAQGEMPQLGGAALLVPPAQPHALAEAIAQLAADPELRTAMSRAARAYATSRTWAHAAERIEQLAIAV